MNRTFLAALLCLVSTPAIAAEIQNSISNEIGVGSSQTDLHNPRSGQVMDTLSAGFDLGSGWILDLTAGLTLVPDAKGVAGGSFGSRGGDVLYFSPAVAYQASEHTMLGLALAYSPASELRGDIAIPNAPLPGQSVEALLSSKTSSSSIRATFSYDTAGDSNFETGVDFDLGVNHFETEQRIVTGRDPAGVVIDSDYCLTHPCTVQLLELLRGLQAPLTQTEVRAGITETFFLDTDIGLAASYFFYDRDLAEARFFSLASEGRAMSGFGNGVPLAPLQWSLRPEVTHRFGNLSARLWLEHGMYVRSEGTSNILGAKLQYKFSRRFRMWLIGSWQRDRDVDGNVTLFNQVALGVMWLY